MHPKKLIRQRARRAARRRLAIALCGFAFVVGTAAFAAIVGGAR